MESEKKSITFANGSRIEFNPSDNIETIKGIGIGSIYNWVDEEEETK